jgi:hypothetical protein
MILLHQKAALAFSDEPDIDVEYAIWRIRLDRWRVVYCQQIEEVIVVLAVRKRPP